MSNPGLICLIGVRLPLFQVLQLTAFLSRAFHKNLTDQLSGQREKKPPITSGGKGRETKVHLTAWITLSLTESLAEKINDLLCPMEEIRTYLSRKQRTLRQFTAVLTNHVIGRK